MARGSHILEGYRTALTHPILTLAEIAWRWTLAAAGLFVCGLAFLEYLNSIPVDDADLWLLGTNNRVLVARALQHMLRGSGGRLAVVSLLLLLSFLLAWIVVGSMARVFSIDVLVRKFRGVPVRPDGAMDAGSLWSVAGLNLLRAATGIAAILAGFALLIVIGQGLYLSPGRAFLALISGAVMIWLARAFLNWLLSISSIFAVRDHAGPLESMTAAVDFMVRQRKAVLSVNSAFGIARSVIFGAAIVLVVALIALGEGHSVFRVVVACGILLLAYCAWADFLFVGRLAAYVHILEEPEEPVVPGPAMPVAPPVTHVAMSSSVPVANPHDDRVDQDELILGDPEA